MLTSDFLRRVLPAAGFYILAAFPPGGGKPQHKITKSLTALVDHAEKLDAKGLEVYHACSSYKERRIWDERKERWRIRTAANAAFVRSQWLDIDVGEEKAAKGQGYATQREAVAALADACKQLSLPLPMLVSSGWGVHAYWVFDRDVPADYAKPHMDSLSAALSDVGLLHDTSRTADVASILRPVGMLNRKRDTPKEVKLLRDAPAVSVDAFYSKLPEPQEKTLLDGEPPQIAGMVEGDWTSGTQEYATPSAKLIVSKCRALYDVAKAQGDVPEPYWRAMIGIVKFTEEGDELIHTWSQGDGRYSRSETQDKIDSYEAKPTTCSEFARHTKACDNCPFNGRIKSPVALGVETEVEEVPEPVASKAVDVVVPEDLAHYAKIADTEQLPFWDQEKYRWNGDQMFVKVLDGKKFKWEPFSEMLYYPFLRFETEDRTRAVKVCALVDVERNRWRIFDIEMRKVAEPQALAYALGEQEVLYMPSAKSRNRQFVQDLIEGLRYTGLETTTYNAFGWYDQGCVMGDQMVTTTGKAPVFLGSRVPEEIREGFGMKGTAMEWVSLVDQIYNRAGAEAFQFGILCGFAAPLVHLCESDMWHGIPVAYVGVSGGGKSTISKVACSIYGDPRKLTIQANEEGTTLKALIQRVSTMRHLPIVLDEITGRETPELQALLFALSNGKPKLRLKPTGEELTAGQQWDTVTFVTGNQSITQTLAQSDVLRADATQVRCFEIYLPDDYVQKVFAGLNAKDMIEHQLLSRNYGVVGEEYIRFLARNRYKVTKRLQRRRAEFSAKTQEESRERFYYDLIATALEAGELASKLGFIKFDMKRLRQWALAHVESMRGVRHTSLDTAEDYLQAFLSHLHAHTVISKYYRDGRQRMDDERVAESLREPLARNALDDRRFIVTLKAFQDWCQGRKIDSSWLLGQLEKQGYVPRAPERMRLLKGTNMSGSQARCIEFDYDKLDGTHFQQPSHLSVVNDEESTNGQQI